MLGITVHLTSLGGGSLPAVGAAQILIWSHSCVSCLQGPQLSELVHFLFWELSLAFYMFRGHRGCLADRVDLICSLYRCWICFGSSSLATLPLGFSCGFFSHLYMWVCSWAALEDLLLWGPVMEVMQQFGSQGFWQHQVLRGVGC